MSKQPLNEAYPNKLLEAAQKIGETYDEIIRLMRSRTPYEEWPKHCQIAGVSNELGCLPPGSRVKRKFDPMKYIPIP